MRLPITLTALMVLNTFSGILPVWADVTLIPDSGADKPHEPRRHTTIEVQNNRNVDVTVYAQTGTEEVRLGVVPSDSIVTLKLPDWFIAGSASIDIFVQPKGQFEEETGPLDVRDGDRIGVIVPPTPRANWLMLDLR